MTGLGSVRGRTAILLAALMLSVAALGLVAVHQALQPAAPSGWDALLTSMLSDPLLSGSTMFAEPTTSSAGLLDAVGGDGLLLVGIWLALVPLAARLGWVLAGRMTRPLIEVALATEAAGPGRPRRPSRPGRRSDEYGRLHEALDGLLDRFDRHDSERRRLIDETAHEVRNPLAAMRTSLEVALDEAAGPDELRAAAEVAQRAGERIAHSIDGLQTGSLGSPGANRTVVALATVAGELARDHRPEAARRGVEIRVIAAPDVAVVAERDGLRHALENLLVNAIRFAPPGSPVIVGAGAAPGWRWLGVRDFGPGIEAVDQPLVFAHGWRGGEPDGGDGRGIGLALVRQVVEAHRGAVRLTSVPRGGSSFVMWLPAVEPDGTLAVRIDSMPDPLWWPPQVMAAPPSCEVAVARRQATLPA